MLRILRSILSRITPEEIQVLIQPVMEVELNPEERLRGTVELIWHLSVIRPKPHHVIWIHSSLSIHSLCQIITFVWCHTMINVLCVPSSVEPRGDSVNRAPSGPPWWSQDWTREQDDRLQRLQAIILPMEHTSFEEFRSDLSSQQDECEHQKMEAIKFKAHTPFHLALQGLSAGSPSPECWVNHLWVHSETPQRLCRRFS